MNRARGEVTVRLAGEERRLCLTLGALAEMEGALAVEGFEALAGRLRTPSAGDLTAVLAALLAGGGEEARTARRLAEMCDPRDAALAVADAFRAAA